VLIPRLLENAGDSGISKSKDRMKAAKLYSAVRIPGLLRTIKEIKFGAFLRSRANGGLTDRLVAIGNCEPQIKKNGQNKNESVHYQKPGRKSSGDERTWLNQGKI